MANNHDDYNELLKNFESKTAGQAPRTTGAPKRPVNTTRDTSANAGRGTGTRSTTPRYSAPPVNNSQDKGTYKGGVYFSNPPRDIDKEAAREKRAFTGKGEAIRKNISDENTKSSKRKKSNQKTGGNAFQKFVGTDRFKNAMKVLAVIVVASVILCIYGIRCIKDVVAINVEDKAIEVTVENGMTDQEVLKILKQKDLINNRFFCQLFLSFFEQDGEYISGVYTLSPSMGVEKMIATMKTDFKSAETVSLTFPEGWTIEQIAEKLEANQVCTASSFISTLQNVDFSNEYEFIKEIPDKDKRFRILEGYIYPDTYEFYVGENASSVVRRFLNNFDNRWTEEYQTKAQEMGLTIDEVITMASILQEEAANTKQMPTIASVLYNRLDRPGTFPRIECDSTLDYLHNTVKPTLTSSVEDSQRYTQFQEYYDTYNKRNGLTVGPIANPGDAAINAALNPDETDYLFFRHNEKTGDVYYAITDAEHEQNGRIIAKENAGS